MTGQTPGAGDRLRLDPDVRAGYWILAVVLIVLTAVFVWTFLRDSAADHHCRDLGGHTVWTGSADGICVSPDGRVIDTERSKP